MTADVGRTQLPEELEGVVTLEPGEAVLHAYYCVHFDTGIPTRDLVDAQRRRYLHSLPRDERLKSSISYGSGTPLTAALAITSRRLVLIDMLLQPNWSGWFTTLTLLRPMAFSVKGIRLSLSARLEEITSIKAGEKAQDVLHVTVLSAGKSETISVGYFTDVSRGLPQEGEPISFSSLDEIAEALEESIRLRKSD